MQSLALMVQRADCFEFSCEDIEERVVSSVDDNWSRMSWLTLKVNGIVSVIKNKQKKQWGDSSRLKEQTVCNVDLYWIFDWVPHHVY